MFWAGACFQRLAGIPEDEFEQALGEVQRAAAADRGSATATAVLRLANPQQEKRPDERWLEANRFVDRCEKLLGEAPAVMELVRFGRYPGQEDGIVYDAALGSSAASPRRSTTFGRNRRGGIHEGPHGQQIRHNGHSPAAC